MAEPKKYPRAMTADEVAMIPDTEEFNLKNWRTGEIEVITKRQYADLIASYEAKMPELLPDFARAYFGLQKHFNQEMKLPLHSFDVYLVGSRAQLMDSPDRAHELSDFDFRFEPCDPSVRDIYASTGNSSFHPFDEKTPTITFTHDPYNIIQVFLEGSLYSPNVPLGRCTYVPESCTLEQQLHWI